MRTYTSELGVERFLIKLIKTDQLLKHIQELAE